MTDIEKIIAVEEIKKLKAKYFRFVDLKMWDDLRGIFTPDVELHYVTVRAEPFGLEDGLATIISSLTGKLSVHHGFMPEIEILSPTTATGLWAMQDRIYSTEASGGERTSSKVLGHGHYHETYERRDGRWLIRSLKLTRLRRSQDTELVTSY